MRQTGAKPGGGDQFGLQLVQQQIGPRLQQSYDAVPIHLAPPTSLLLRRTLGHASLLTIRVDLEGPRGAHTKAGGQKFKATFACVVGFQKLPPKIIVIGSRHALNHRKSRTRRKESD